MYGQVNVNISTGEPRGWGENRVITLHQAPVFADFLYKTHVVHDFGLHCCSPPTVSLDSTLNVGTYIHFWTCNADEVLGIMKW